MFRSAHATLPAVSPMSAAPTCDTEKKEKEKKEKTPAKAFTLPAETKMGTRPGRAVTREFIGGGVYSLISVVPN